MANGALSRDGAPGGGGSIAGPAAGMGGNPEPDSVAGLAGFSGAGATGSGNIRVGGGGTFRLVPGTPGALGSEPGKVVAATR